MSKAKFSELAEELRALIERERAARHPPSISREMADYLMTALEAFDRDPDAGLDQAFALARGRGRPTASGDETKNYRLAREIYFMRWAGQTWATIEAHYDRDERDLRRIYERFQTRISAELAEKITAAISG